MSPSPPSTEDSAPAAKRSSVAWIRSGAACPPSLPRISRPSLSTRERGNDHGQDLPALRCEGDRRLLDERDYGARRWPSVSHASPVLLLRRLYAEKAQRPSGTIHGRKVRRSGPRALSGGAPTEGRAANGSASSAAARARETPPLVPLVFPAGVVAALEPFGPHVPLGREKRTDLDLRELPDRRGEHNLC